MISIKKLWASWFGTTNVPKTENKQVSGTIKETEYIENTPFTIVSTEEGEHYLTIGMTRITDAISLKEAHRIIKRKDWNTIMQVINIVSNNITTQRIKTIDKAVEDNPNQTKLFNASKL